MDAETYLWGTLLGKTPMSTTILPPMDGIKGLPWPRSASASLASPLLLYGWRCWQHRP